MEDGTKDVVQTLIKFKHEREIQDKKNKNIRSVEEEEDMAGFDSMIENFEKTRFRYSTRANRKFLWLIFGVIAGFLVSMYAILPALKLLMIKSKSTVDARAMLKNYIPETKHFADQTSTQTILTAFDYDNAIPLALMKNSDDLLLKDHTRALLKEPMSILDAVSAAIADPFVFAPHVVTTTNTNQTREQVGLISGYMHASPPTFVGLGLLLDKTAGESEPTVERFLVTEVGFDYKIKEEEAPSSIASWGKQFSSLIYTNKIKATQYMTDMLFK